GVVDARAYHGRGNAVGMRGITPGKAAFHAGMPMIGLAVLPGHHAHDLFAFHFGPETTTHPAIRTGGNDSMIGLALFDDRVFDKRAGRTGLNAGAARHALAAQEAIVLPRGDPGLEPATGQGQGKGSLDVITGTHATTADDAQ